MVIEGATGEHSSAKTNGLFEPTDELRDGLPMYQKKGDSSTWLMFNGGDRKWFIQSPKNLQSTACRAYCKADAICLPHDCPAGRWQIVAPGGSTFENQASITIGISDLRLYLFLYFLI